MVLLQITFLLFISFIYNTDYALCMMSSDESDRLSDIAPPSNELIEHHIEGILFHEKDEYAHNFRENYTSEEWATLKEEEKILGPAFQCMEETCQASYLENDLETLDNKTFEEKLDVLQQAYLHESAERRALELDRDYYYDKVIKRHESLLEAKESIKSLTQENLKLKNQINELMKNIKK